MQEQIRDALKDKNDALDARKSGALDEALALVERAIGRLRELWEQNKGSAEGDGGGPSPDVQDLVEALAEAYGVKGGILRSKGDFKGAADAYGEGLPFEQHPARKADSSYNLVQRLTNRVLAAPREAIPEDLRLELEAARRELQRQLSTSRGRDAWAAADMITIQLLQTPQDPSHGGQLVGKAYSVFEGLKPRPKPRVYESTLRALEDFKQSLEEIPAGERSEDSNVIVGQLEQLIRQFREGFRKAKAG